MCVIQTLFFFIYNKQEFLFVFNVFRNTFRQFLLPLQWLYGLIYSGLSINLIFHYLQRHTIYWNQTERKKVNRLRILSVQTTKHPGQFFHTKMQLSKTSKPPLKAPWPDVRRLHRESLSALICTTQRASWARWVCVSVCAVRCLKVDINLGGH